MNGRGFATMWNGRNDYPPKVKTILDAVGDLPISKITICRIPLGSAINGALSAVGFKSNYDTLYHLCLLFGFSNGQQIIVEKNEVINFDYNPSIPATAQRRDITANLAGLTLNGLMASARTSMGLDKLLNYSARDSNCQDFVLGVLGNLANSDDVAFIKQDTKDSFSPTQRKISNTVTKIGQKWNELIHGGSILSKRRIRTRRNK